MKAYVGIADSDGLRSFVPEGDVPDGLMILEAEAALGRGWACFWAAVDEQTADEIRDELASGQRRDAMNLLWVLAREIVRYPTDVDSRTADLNSITSPAFEVGTCSPAWTAHLDCTGAEKGVGGGVLGPAVVGARSGGRPMAW